jgi:hypothetical protein
MRSKYAVLSTLAILYAGSALAGGGPYPEPAIPTSEVAMSRAEVVAELREAKRFGLLTTGEEDVRTPTPGEARQIADAGRRAAENGRVTAENKHSE